MTSSRPYLIRALYDWIVDNSLTPYLVINARADDVSVPQQYVNKDGQIILNVAPRAVMELSMDHEAVVFKARFGGVPTDVYAPCHAVMGIYARENGQGMMFENEPSPSPTSPSSPDKSGKPGERRPSLKIVK